MIRPRPSFRHATMMVCFLFELVAGAAGAVEHDVAVSALTPLPAGILLPVQLAKALHAGATPKGTKIVLKTTQRVPVAEHLYLGRGAEVYGEVIASDAGNEKTARPPSLALRITSLRYRHQEVPLMTKAIAIANFTDVDETSLPPNGAIDRGNSNPASWTTTQVGGDEIYRSGWVGEVADTVMHTVGYADYYGVYRLPARDPKTGTMSLPRAMGVFSTTAEGLYGFDQNSHLTSSAGVITIVGGARTLVVRGGDDLLLEVVAGPSN